MFTEMNELSLTHILNVCRLTADTLYQNVMHLYGNLPAGPLHSVCCCSQFKKADQSTAVATNISCVTSGFYLIYKPENRFSTSCTIDV